MHDPARARISEGDIFEAEARLQGCGEFLRRSVGDFGLGVENLVDTLRRRHADHALVQDRAQIAHRAEDLDTQHQDDEQRGE